MRNTRRDRAIAARIEAWFPGAARDLPWRVEPRDPYHALVAESMLVQTQVSRVVERHAAFIRRFPTLRALARADERDVLALWSGLGYYARARNLLGAARAIVEDHHGTVPADAAALRALPGVGGYTAGAIASIVFGRREALVDGNVQRVLLRVEGRAPASPAETRRWAWESARELVRHAAAPGVLNEGLMELGATVCTPRSPRCGACPLAALCRSRRGLADPLPGPAPRSDAAPGARPTASAAAKRSKPVLHCAAILVADSRTGELLVERRPATGMWAGLWQAPTLERLDRAPTRAQAAATAGIDPDRVPRRPADTFTQETSHRHVRFTVWHAEVDRGAVAPAPPGRERRWIRPERAQSLALSSPQRRILTARGDAAAERIVSSPAPRRVGAVSLNAQAARNGGDGGTRAGPFG